MKGRQAAIVLGAFLGALATDGLSAGDNDRAVPRGGGSSGGGSRGGSSGGGGGSSATSRHPGSGSSGSQRGSSYSEPSRSSQGSSARTPRTDAQRRHPAPGTGTGYRHGHGGRYYGGYYPYYPYYNNFYWGYGYYFSPWYYPYYGGFYGGYGYPYYGGGYYGAGAYGAGYHRGYYDSSGSVRVIVEPRETKVYVDEYYAGTVDDFDGIFQRLNLRPGRHDIALKLEGFETHKVKLYVPLDHTLKIRHKMVRGASDRVSEQTVGDPADGERYARRAERERADEYEERGEANDDRYEQREPRDDSWPASRERGTIRLDVSPADASIYVDGMFRGTGQDLRRLSLPAGRHRLEVVRPGYRTLERDVEVQAGETEQVDVNLPKS
jgi:hypothetical protein